MRMYTGIPQKGQVEDATAKKLIHGYNATVSYVDALIGKILKALTDNGLNKNTIVILVSDHGYSLQEHTQWAKYNPYRITSRVPLLIRVPDLTKGDTTNALTELVDLYPTLCDLCGIEPPAKQLDGKSLLPVLKNPDQKGKDYIFTKTANAFTIKTAEYAYTEFIDLKTMEPITSMLYNHVNDPDENENVSGKPGYKNILKELKTILHTDFKSNITGKIK